MEDIGPTEDWVVAGIDLRVHIFLGKLDVQLPPDSRSQLLGSYRRKGLSLSKRGIWIC